MRSVRKINSISVNTYFSLLIIHGGKVVSLKTVLLLISPWLFLIAGNLLQISSDMSYNALPFSFVINHVIPVILWLARVFDRFFYDRSPFACYVFLPSLYRILSSLLCFLI